MVIKLENTVYADTMNTIYILPQREHFLYIFNIFIDFIVQTC